MPPEIPPIVSLDVAIDHSIRVNFAFQQNAIPVIQRIEFRNNCEKDLHDVVCRFKPKPDWAPDFEQAISLVPANSDYILSDVQLELNLEYLSSLSERIRGEIEVEVFAKTSGEGQSEKIHQCVLSIDVFAFDEWTGLESLPEILAAFVTPNITFIETLLSRAANFLSTRTDSSSLDGYQKKSKKRVYQILDSIYDAVREQGIRYSNPPASFETTGQRVRFGEQIFRSKLATCLDLSLLFAAAIEQAGLRPIILMHSGHAYVGCWLIEESFPEPACDDLQSVRKRVELEEIVVFESTLCCEGSTADFNHSVSAARQHLSKDEIFQYAIGIWRSRASGIRPLPISRGNVGIDFKEAERLTKVLKLPPTNRAMQKEFATDIPIDELPKSPEDRIEHWKQQLLDLTLRNRLLNFRETKQTIPIICSHPEKLEDELAASKSFKILEQTKLMAGLDPRSLALQERQFAEDPVFDHLVQELHAKRLRSSLTELELSRRLLEIYRRTKAEMEESGANTLYLALGFLEWKETKGSDRSHRAPILLIPLKLDRKSINQGFSIQRYDEDAIVNVTLLELLKRDFEMEIPGVNPPPEDESGIDVSKVFWLFQQSVKDMPGWEVHREVWIAQFSFSKFLLWKDLKDRVSTLSENSVVDHLVNRAGQPFLDSVEVVSERELDQTVQYEDIYCPVSADSSQLAAIIAASKGKNFVMHGPPGTGKSQTITNLIAHCLAISKRVLFVAEKRAALEVVHKRLSQIGLSPFCLELHSNKTGKADVLRQFGESLDFTSQHSPQEWRYIASQLERSREELNVFVNELHRIYPNGMSAYHCYSWLIAHRDCDIDFKEIGKLKIDRIEEQSREKYDELLKLCDDLLIRGSERRLSAETKSSLRPFAHDLWTPDWEERVIDAATSLKGSCDVFERTFEEFGNSVGLAETEMDKPSLEQCVELGKLLVNSQTLPTEFVQGSDWDDFRKQANMLIEAGRRRDKLKNQLEGFKIPSLLSFDIAPVKKQFEKLNQSKGIVSKIRKWFLLKQIRQMREKSAIKWKSDDAPNFFEKVLDLKEAQSAIYQAKNIAAERLGTYWNFGEANWDELGRILDFGDRLHDLISRIAGGNVDRLANLKLKVGQLLPMSTELLVEEKPIALNIKKLDTTWEKLEANLLAFRDLASVDAAVHLSGQGFLGELRELGNRLIDFRSDLQSWCRWQDSRKKAVAEQLEPLILAVERGILPLEKSRLAFEKTYRDCFLLRLISVSETLRNFWGDEHQKRIESFNDLDERYTKLTIQAIIARLAGDLPRARSEECPRNTELGILQRERAKKARHKPVRKLFSEISSIVPKLNEPTFGGPISRYRTGQFRSRRIRRSLTDSCLGCRWSNRSRKASSHRRRSQAATANQLLRPRR